MSLETIHLKLRKVEKETPAWKILFSGFVISMLSVGIVSVINPTYLAQYEDLLPKTIIITMLTMAFMAMYLAVVGGGLATAIMITWILIKSRDRYYQTNGTIIGNSLSTNHKFLSNLAKGLDLILFRRLLMRFVLLFDLVFEEMKEGLRYEIKEILKEKDKIIQEKNQIIRQQDQTISDMSFKADYKDKKLHQIDKFQTKLEDFQK